MTPDELRALADEATPGPWFWDSYARIFRTHEQWGEEKPPPPVAIVSTGYDGAQHRDTGRADARLIALAPDLARLCADAFDVVAKLLWDEWSAERPYGGSLEEMFVKLESLGLR